MGHIKPLTRLSFANIQTNSVYTRHNLVTIKNMARPDEDEVPRWDAAQFERLLDHIIDARIQGKPVIWSMGAHVIKNGLSRYVIEMVRHGFLTHVSGNGATSIHDFELAFLGETSEDVATAIEDGSFGMWEETGRYMNEAIQQGVKEGFGYGESLYRYLEKNPEKFPHYDDCVFVQCQHLGVPYTCHISIGTDIIHQHPIVDFEALGLASGRDFDTMCQSVAELEHGGVFLNFGSAISGPETFLKAVTMARNAGLPMKGIVAANFDIVPVPDSSAVTEAEAAYYYRPRRIFSDRLSELDGEAYLFHGLHQVTIPNLFHGLMKRTRERGVEIPPYERGERRYRKRDLTLYPVSRKTSKVTVESLLRPGESHIPGWQAEQFDHFITLLKAARSGGHRILVSLGGNVMSNKVSRYVIALLKQGYISHLAVNGCAAMQDFELAAFGRTEEVVEGNLSSGMLGMWEELGDYFHEALQEGYRAGYGYGQSLIVYAQHHKDRFPYLDDSLLGWCSKLDIPYTCHITIGTDTVQQHPNADFAAQGGASGRDFHAYCQTVIQLDGGVFMNFGSTVTGPEVFLKALSIARNLGNDVHHITTANFDLVTLGDYHRKVGYEDWDYYYRPRKNIIHRPTSLGGKGFHFEGRHEETIPALWNRLL